MRLLWRYWPLVLLLAAMAAVFISGATHYFNWSMLARNQAALEVWIGQHPLSAPLLYILLYAVSAALALPESAVLTVAGGLLFGFLLGGTLAVIGSSIGALVLFAAVRHHLADAVAARAGRLLARIRPTLERDGFSYLLMIRLIPAFPFWLVNIAAGLSGMRLLPYTAGTVLGIIPATFIYASIGAGVGEVLATGGRPNLSVVFSPGILGPLMGLAVLSLLPVAWRRWKRTDA